MADFVMSFALHAKTRQASHPEGENRPQDLICHSEQSEGSGRKMTAPSGGILSVIE